jgi:hypothetical protein
MLLLSSPLPLPPSLSSSPYPALLPLSAPLLLLL